MPAPAAPPRKSQRRLDQKQNRVRRSGDYPTDVDGARNYFLKAVPPDLWQQFDTATKKHRKAWRWTLLTLMKEYAAGTITLKEQET